MKTKQQHTPEPWEVREYEKDGKPGISVLGPDEVIITECWPCDDLDRTNARRIVACINACEGMTTGDLEQDRAACTKSIKELATDRDAMRAENQRLREALRAAEQYMTRQRAKSNSPFDPEVLKQTRALLRSIGEDA